MPFRLRPGIFVSALLLAATALAEDKRVQVLQKQLSSAKDPRLRAQVCTLLGKTGSGDAIPVLCGVLRDDRENLVRQTAAQGLAELGSSDAIPCLKAAQSDAEGALARQIQRALDALKPSGGLYVVIDVNGSVPSDVVNYAYDQLKKEVSNLGATVAARGESKSEAASAVKSHGYRGYLMKTNLTPNGASGLKIDVLIMTYPGEALQGTWNVKAAGGKPEAQLKAMVPRVVNDAATDLEWK